MSSFLDRLTRGRRAAPSGAAAGTLSPASFGEALRTAEGHRRTRGTADKADPRFRDGIVYPHFEPKFTLDLTGGQTVFTIGSCFARNIEEALEPLGVDLPTRRFRVPTTEFADRPNGLLNEFNPGALAQRILDALDGTPCAEMTIVASGDKYADLLLMGGADVAWRRALERRADIAAVYADLARADIAVVTLGLIECWYDRDAARYLNRAPPFGYAKSAPERFEFRRLDVATSLALLEPAFHALQRSGTNVVLSVSPVPIAMTFTKDDPLVADSYSKSVLRAAADDLARNFANVDYFPSFEIVKSGGTASYIDDNIHVRGDLVRQITRWMVERYSPSGAVQPPANGGVAAAE